MVYGARRVLYVFSGAKEMSALAEDIGSPIANILTPRRLLPLSWMAIRQLASLPTGGAISDSVVRAIYLSSGGHPFLAQYLLHFICEFDLDESRSRVQEAQNRFLDSDAAQFANWWRRHFSRNDRIVYVHLAQSEKKVPRSQVITMVGAEAANSALETLTTFGVIRYNSRDQFKQNGSLFRDWITRHSPSEKGDGVCDVDIHRRLGMLDPEIAIKYATAWSIYNSSLDNYSGAVGEVRDVVTLTLHALAPDSVVQAADWFSKETENGRPTRRQRVEYIVRNSTGTTKKHFSEQLTLLDTLIDQLGSYVVQTYAEASAKTHKTATREQAWRCLKQMDSVLAQLL